MIRVDIQGYCENCFNFEAVTENQHCVFIDGKPLRWGDTIVRCANKDLCDRIKHHLENTLYKKESE